MVPNRFQNEPQKQNLQDRKQQSNMKMILIGSFATGLVVLVLVGIFVIKRYSNPAAAFVDKVYADYRNDTKIQAINSQEVIKIQKAQEERAEKLRQKQNAEQQEFIRQREAEQLALAQKKAEEDERSYRENLERIHKLVETEMASTQAYVKNASQELRQLKIDAALLNEAISDVAVKFDQCAQEAEKRSKTTFHPKAKYVALLFENESIKKLYVTRWKPRHPLIEQKSRRQFEHMKNPQHIFKRIITNIPKRQKS